MRRSVLLLVGVVVLYLLTSLVLYGIYGPSIGFLQGEDCWQPDGNGGWVAHGSPDDPMPDVASVNIPILVRYLPIFVPALLLALFLFTPLGRKVDGRRPENPDAIELQEGVDYEPGEVEPDSGDKPPSQ